LLFAEYLAGSVRLRTLNDRHFRRGPRSCSQRWTNKILREECAEMVLVAKGESNLVKSLIGSVAGAVVGAILGIMIGGLSYQLGDTSSIIYAGRGMILVIGLGLGAVAGAIIGSTGALLDAIGREWPAR